MCANVTHQCGTLIIASPDCMVCPLPGSPPWEGRGLSHISAMWVCATVKGMVFRQLSSEIGDRIGFYLPVKWLVLII